MIGELPRGHPGDQQRDSITIVLRREVGSSVRVDPRLDVHKVGHEAGHLTAHHATVAHDDVLVVGLGVEVLRDGCAQMPRISVSGGRESASKSAPITVAGSWEVGASIAVLPGGDRHQIGDEAGDPAAQHRRVTHHHVLVDDRGVVRL